MVIWPHLHIKAGPRSTPTPPLKKEKTTHTQLILSTLTRSKPNTTGGCLWELWPHALDELRGPQRREAVVHGLGLAGLVVREQQHLSVDPMGPPHGSHDHITSS